MHSFLKKPFSQKVISFVVAQYLRFVLFTSRCRRHGEENISPYWKAGDPVIVLFWHNRMGLCSFAWRCKNPFGMLISSHGDGQMIARVVRYFGIQWIPGSTSQSGSQALRDMLSWLKSGASVGITPDGPRGPCYDLKEGVFGLSLMSQCPVLVCSWRCSRSIRLKTWDQFIIPLPFSRIDMTWSPAILPPQNKSEKEDFLAAVRGYLMADILEERF